MHRLRACRHGRVARVRGRRVAVTFPRVEIHRFVALTGASRNPCREERWGCAMEPPGAGGLTHQQLIGAGPQVLGAGLNSSENISRRSAAARFEASAGVVQKPRVGRTQTAFTLDHRKRDDDLRRRQGQQSMSQRIQRGITASKLLSRSAIIRSQGHDRNKVFCAVRSFCRQSSNTVTGVALTSARSDTPRVGRRARCWANVDMRLKGILTSREL
jgi:hypothetical protein